MPAANAAMAQKSPPVQAAAPRRNYDEYHAFLDKLAADRRESEAALGDLHADLDVKRADDVMRALPARDRGAGDVGAKKAERYEPVVAAARGQNAGWELVLSFYRTYHVNIMILESLTSVLRLFLERRRLLRQKKRESFPSFSERGTTIIETLKQGFARMNTVFFSSFPLDHSEEKESYVEQKQRLLNDFHQRKQAAAAYKARAQGDIFGLVSST